MRLRLNKRQTDGCQCGGQIIQDFKKRKKTIMKDTAFLCLRDKISKNKYQT